ncbi:periostin isoform X3 [Latimeria chalumnae]|uniref:periostin isoform X3 n=1 Tax=Latimeria chalumnae TaxID=7897 RepID=UPI00313E863D
MKLLFLATFSVFALSAFDQADSSAYDKIMVHSRIRAKKEGPNVCAFQQVVGASKKYFSTCSNWSKKSICGKPAIALYDCCPGYMKMDGMRGCPAVAPIDHVYGTLGVVGATSTQSYAERSGLKEEIEGRGSYTFFAPSNDAWEILNPDTREALISNVNLELLNALHYHMVNKRLLTKDLKDRTTVPSMYSDQGLLINHYSNGIVTVNCARIVRANQIATNGVVHMIDRVISVVGNTIQDFIELEDNLSSLRAAAIASGLLDTLGEPGHYTVFAPTNEAFEKISRDSLERIMSDKVALEALLKFHILNSVQCSEAIMGGAIYETLEGNIIEVSCKGDAVTINGIEMVKQKDIVTSNGVIHLIDEVLIPDSAKQVLELAGKEQTTFKELITQMGLTASLRRGGEYTLLAPLNGAFTDEILRMDQRFLRLIMENHILKVKVILSELYNGQRLETLGGKKVRVFIYRTAVCFENSCMIRGSKEGRNGAIHLFRKIIMPAEKSMITILRDDERFSTFLTLIEAAGLLELFEVDGDWTLFAPTNEAFKDLSEEDMDTLTGDPNALRAILLYHLNNGVLIGGGIEPHVTNILKSVQGSKLMTKVVNDSVVVNDVKAEESDLMATNGVIHVINSLLYPADVPVGNEQLLILLKRLIKTIQIKYIRGATFKEIPLTFLTGSTRFIKLDTFRIPGGSRRIITKTIPGEPQVSTVTIDREPRIQYIGGDTIRRVSQNPSLTSVTRIIQSEPEVRVIQGSTTRAIPGDTRKISTTRRVSVPRRTSRLARFRSRRQPRPSQ